MTVTAIGHRTRRTSAPDGDRVLVRRMEAEYREMPGLRLTTSQAARLWNLSPRQAEALLGRLVDAGFLMRDRRGLYRRRDCPRCA